MNTEQREQVLAHYTEVCHCEWSEDDFTRTRTNANCVIHGNVPDPLDALLARLSAVEQERDELQRQLNKAWALEKYGCEKWQAAKARVEAAEQALREILNWSYDRELGVGTFVLLVQESARAVLAPSQDSEQ